MIKKLIFICSFYFISTYSLASGYDVFGIGIYDVKFDGSDANSASDFRYERRFGNPIFTIGPESENFFNVNPFLGVEITSDNASYFLGGIYLEDNIGSLFTGKKSNTHLTPSFGIGYYDDGDGKKLGNNVEFRTTIEISYELKSSNRIGFSFGHISNANLGDKNPGVEIFNISYQIPFN